MNIIILAIAYSIILLISIGSDNYSSNASIIDSDCNPIFLHHRRNTKNSLIHLTNNLLIHTIMSESSTSIPVVDTKVNVLMIGTGEYTTGYVGGTAADSDKGSGVVALTMFDLRRRNKVSRIGMCGVNGTKFPGIRQHMNKCIATVYRDMDISCDTYPSDTEIVPTAYVEASKTFQRGDVAIIFTPDDTHYDIAMQCIQQGMHVMVTKPIVQTLEQHINLAKAAAEHNVLVAIEVHKRLDPFYADARDRVQTQLGKQFQYMYSYMSQPKHQLDTFKAWAGKSSDISYYLNSHHIDWCEWTLYGIARPIRVTGTSSTGIAHAKDMDTEDSITLTVQWENLVPTTTTTSSSTKRSVGCAVYTSSWVAPKSDVHSQQRFFYMGSSGEVLIDQAHRGCTVSTDSTGFASVNPLFMKYTPTNGYFSGQQSYGVRSFEVFIDACRSINAGKTQPSDYNDGSLATVSTTYQCTAILEAGRRSLDNDSRPMDIIYENDDSIEPIDIKPHEFV
jgi:D-galacturonate reductase